MRKQPSKPVALEEADLINFLDTQSDFAFELKTLKILNENGFCCEHGGTYHDPVTRKPRQFDIRATKVWKDLCMQLAVECKNLSDTSPLLILCVPRSPAEAFHEVVSPFKAKAFHKDASLFPNSVEGVLPPAFTQKTESIRFSGKESIYKPHDPVGKSTERVAKNDDGTFKSNDSDVYERWAQAVSSAQDLVNSAVQNAGCYTATFPVLVVPDRTLWVVEFDADGSRIGNPRQVERCSYFIGKSYRAGAVGNVFYEVSHLEFVTIGGIETIIDGLFLACKS